MAVWEYFRHLDDHVLQLIQQYHGWTYGIFFLVLFCETGLVVTPFLPGDTLLFAAGLFSRPDVSGPQGGLNIWLVLLTLTAAPIAGDNVNYFFGRWLGPHLFHNPKSKIFKKENLDRTHAFYERHGSKTVILARWIPVVRTFSPFVAGMGAMGYRKFLSFSIAGAVIWVWALVGAGYWLGQKPWIQRNLIWVMILMVVVTGGPIVIEVAKRVYLARKYGEKPGPISDPAPKPSSHDLAG